MASLGRVSAMRNCNGNFELGADKAERRHMYSTRVRRNAIDLQQNAKSRTRSKKDEGDGKEEGERTFERVRRTAAMRVRENVVTVTRGAFLPRNPASVR